MNADDTNTRCPIITAAFSNRLNGYIITPSIASRHESGVTPGATARLRLHATEGETRVVYELFYLYVRECDALGRLSRHNAFFQVDIEEFNAIDLIELLFNTVATIRASHAVYTNLV